MLNSAVFNNKTCPIFFWLSRVEKDEQDGILLAAYGGKDPSTGPMAKIKPHTNGDGTRIVGVDICFIDRSNHKNDFDVYVGAETFWPVAKDIEERRFFNRIAKEDQEKQGKYSAPGYYSFKAGKKDEEGHGGGSLNAGFCASTSAGMYCLHGYNATTKANFNIPCSEGSLMLMGALFLQLFDVGHSAQLRMIAQAENRKKWAKDNPPEEVDMCPESVPEDQPTDQNVTIEGTVFKMASGRDAQGRYYFLGEVSGTPILIKGSQPFTMRDGQPFTYTGIYTGNKVRAAGNECQEFIISE